MAKYKIQLTKKATKDLRRLNDPLLRRLLDAINGLGDDPYPQGCKKLVGTEVWRIRVSSYRVLYVIDEEEIVIVVTRAAHRKDVYDDL